MCSYSLAAAILDFPLPVRSDSIGNGTIRKPDPENMGVAVGISLLSCLEAEKTLGSGRTAPLGLRVPQIYLGHSSVKRPCLTQTNSKTNGRLYERQLTERQSKPEKLCPPDF